MSIELSKGARINLDKTSPKTKRFRVALGWQENETDTGHDFDLDVTAFVCADRNGRPKLLNDYYMVFYNSVYRTQDRLTAVVDERDYASKQGVPCTPCLGVIHTGDNTTGAGDGENEALIIEPGKLPKDISEISFVVTIHDAQARKQNFGQVRKSFIRILDDETNTVLANYALDDDFSVETAVEFGCLVKKTDGSWEFQAVGAGYRRGLGEFVAAYQ